MAGKLLLQDITKKIKKNKNYNNQDNDFTSDDDDISNIEED